MTWSFVALQLACGVLLVLAFMTSRSSRKSIWSVLMLLAVIGILLFGALAYLDPLLSYFDRRPSFGDRARLAGWQTF